MPTIYVIELPSGATGQLVMSVTAGEALVAISILMLVAIQAFVLLKDVAFFASKR
jgi:hypothetical protein